jgi:thiol:disulfide interchange protein DsbD
MLPACGVAQEQPLKWNVSVDADTDQPGEYILIFKATLDPGWKVYSQDYDTSAIIKPTPLGLFFQTAGDYELIGETEELGRVKAIREQYFDCIVVKSYEKTVTLRQRVKPENPAREVIGYLGYQTCNDVKCLFPTTLWFSLRNGQLTLFEEPDDVDWETYTQTRYETVRAELHEEGPCATAAMDSTAAGSLTAGQDASSDDPERRSLWGFFILGLGGGLFALLTPCVFPMIPLTVSFFTKRSTNRRKGFFNALLYACSIVLIFIALGFIITYAFGPEMLNDMATNKWFNLLFFAIFIVFAMSFFGAFDINLPSSWVTRADKVSDRGGIVGIFFMAFTLVLVSFSCTMPIIGTVIILIADSQEFWGPLLGMLGFSLALAIPFALFAAFPAWLNSMPKSGGWLNRIKVTLGFAELALAFKFFSVADLAYGWQLLSRDVFLSIWIVLAVLLGVYLLGKIRFSPDENSTHVGIPRFFFAVLSFAFAIYMIPGLWGAPVNILSGITPPGHYQEFTLKDMDKQFMGIEERFDQLARKVSGSGLENPAVAELKRATPPTVLPHKMKPSNALDMYFDYGQALEVAKVSNKPLFVDFTGWGCQSCRKMEDKVWSQDRVWQLLNNEYVIVSLYVDEKESLPEDLRQSPYTGNRVSTIGKLWLDLSRTRYGQLAQPWYVLLDHHEQELAPGRGYTPNVEEYAQFLEAGVVEYKKRNGNGSS